MRVPSKEFAYATRNLDPWGASAMRELERNPITRRDVLGAAVASGIALTCSSVHADDAPTARAASAAAARGAAQGRARLVGSTNALAGMKLHYGALLAGADPLDVAIEVVKVVEADPDDHSVGLGGLPNEDGTVQLDAAVMYGPRGKAGAVAALENILHPSEVARLVLERTDHVLLVGKGAYDFARKHGHEHVELLTEPARKLWLEWKESLSPKDDWLPPPPKLPYQSGLEEQRETPRVAAAPADPAAELRRWRRERVTGTVHCSAMATSGAIACTTTTSGLSWKIPGRVGDSPIIGAGLYCDQEAGSAGSTGRGEANLLSCASFHIVDLMRQGRKPLDAGMEVLRQIVRQTQRQGRYQPDLLDARGLPDFGLKFYVLGLDGTVAGVSLKDPGDYAVSDPEHGPHLEPLEVLHG
jgi:N4-(beta-N-acetylglucosaminyl)-L-asparaginase